MGTNFSEIQNQILQFSFNKWESVVWKWWPFCFGLNVLKPEGVFELSKDTMLKIGTLQAWSIIDSGIIVHKAMLKEKSQ